MSPSDIIYFGTGLGAFGAVVAVWYAFRNKGRYDALHADLDTQRSAFELQALAQTGIVTANEELRAQVEWLRSERTSDQINFEKRFAEEQRTCAVSVAKLEERLRIMEEGFLSSIAKGVQNAVSEGIASVLLKERSEARPSD